MSKDSVSILPSNTLISTFDSTLNGLYVDGICVQEDAILGVGTTLEGKVKLKGVKVESSTVGEFISFATLKDYS